MYCRATSIHRNKSVLPALSQSYQHFPTNASTTTTLNNPGEEKKVVKNKKNGWGK
jgi:hypothetical protein